MQSDNLIFLISQPRAGSTLLQTILENHYEIHTVPEPWIMLHPMYAQRSQGYEAEYNAKLSQTAVEDFIKNLPEGEETYFNGLRRMYTYIYDSALKSSGKRYFLDKTPRYYHIIPELYRTFPNAKFIILLRNPLAVLCSIISTWIKEYWFNLKDYQHDLIDAPHLFIDGIRLIGEDNCLVINYEELLKNPDLTIKSICEKLEIEFYPEILNYRPNKVNKNGYGYNDQKNNAYQTGKPNSKNLDKWVSNLQNPQVWRVVNDYLEMLDKETINQMGYSYDNLRELVNTYSPNKFDLWFTFPLIWLFDKQKIKQSWKYYLVRLNQKIKKTVKN